MSPKVWVLASFVALLVAGAWAALADELVILVALVGLAVIGGALLNAWLTATRIRQLGRAVDGLTRRQQQLATRLDEAIETLDDETRPLPPEHVEQLLRTVRASVARVETAQAQLVDEVTTKVLEQRHRSD